MSENSLPPLVAILRSVPGFLESLTPAELAILPYMHDLWMRPDQRIPDHDWRYCGARAGRGFGKTFGFAVEINRRAELGTRAFAAMAPTEARVHAVQFKNLIETAPPWFRPEVHKENLYWPNDACMMMFTPEEPGRSRSENIDTTWLTELVDWKETKRREAFDTITTATRIGNAQVVWDSTSMGANEVLTMLDELHRADPYTYPMITGSTFDNPLLSRKYIIDEVRKYSGQRLREELFGEHFAEGQGAQFKKAHLDAHRRDAPPPASEIVETLISIDPALSKHVTADEVGYAVGCSTKDKHAHLLEDKSAKMAPEEWGDLAVRDCIELRATGCIIERNHLGDFATALLRSRAESKKLQVRVLAKGDPFPRYTKGVIYVREIVTHENKITRADGPASECELGNVHLVGMFPALEKQLLTYDGSGRSPNRYDAFTQLITALRKLDQEKSAPAAEASASAARMHTDLRSHILSLGAHRIV